MKLQNDQVKKVQEYIRSASLEDQLILMGILENEEMLLNLKLIVKATKKQQDWVMEILEEETENKTLSANNIL